MANASMSPVIAVPKLRLEVDGRSLSNDALYTLTTVRVQQVLSRPTLCELTFASPLPLKSLGDVNVGAHVVVEVALSAGPVFEGDVTALEYSYLPSQEQVLRIRAYDSMHKLRKRQTVRMHVQVTPMDLVKELVAPLGLAVVGAEAGPSLRNVMQHDQSDLRLLQEVCSRYGLYFFLTGDALQLMTLAGRTSDLTLELGKNLHEASVSVNLDPACGAITASGWDAQRVEVHNARAGESRVGRQVDISALDSGDEPERTLVDESAQDDQQAESIAQAALDFRSAREVTLMGVVEGDSSLWPGKAVEVSGVARRIEGTYVLTAVTHLIDSQRGYVCEISTEPPESTVDRSSGHLATWGQVTQVDDPERLGRVKVSLPTFNDVETDWLTVLSAGAGAGKGMIALPAPGDHVLVLFVNRTDSQAVVLGGLYGPGGPPDSGVEGGNVRRYSVLTSGGQKLVFDDVGSRLRFENKDGSFVELAPEKLMIHSHTDFEIDAPGKAVVVRGKTIDFVQG
jgi:phage protein D/phage baseplate assembly protein gpV